MDVNCELFTAKSPWQTSWVGSKTDGKFRISVKVFDRKDICPNLGFCLWPAFLWKTWEMTHISDGEVIGGNCLQKVVKDRTCTWNDHEAVILSFEFMRTELQDSLYKSPSPQVSPTSWSSRPRDARCFSRKRAEQSGGNSTETSIRPSSSCGSFAGQIQ